MHHHTDRIAQTTAFGALAGTRNSFTHGSNILQSMGVGGGGGAEGCGMEEGNVLFNDSRHIDPS